MNYSENLQILPLGHVRLFRRIRKNDGPFLKTCVLFAEFTQTNMFRRNEVLFVKESSDVPKTYNLFLKFRFVIMFVFAARVRVRVQFVVRGSAVR